jgi:hypothetical protein
MTIIHKVNSEELVKLLEYSDMPVIVNMPESLIWAIPLYVRDRSKFVTCGESVCDITGLPMPPRVGVIDSATGCIVPPRNLASATALVPRFDKAGRNKSQILKDMAAKLTADGIDTVCLDFTTQGDDDDD